ncbi:MAG: ATPase [Clostridia bacterium]|jgi:vacuolar-type H+-ATPase subunit H|nr:ATPase [Clostridia bacterium]
MEIFTLLETLEDILEKSKNVPFTDKCIVEKNEILDIIKEIRLNLPDELKQAKWIKEERERIIAEAQKDAEDLMKEAENRIISMIDEHEITKKAYDKKTEIIADANEMYREITKGTTTYVDSILADIESNMKNLSSTLINVESSVKTALETIQNNRKELK